MFISILLSILSGILLTLSFPKAGFSWLAFAGLVPLFFAVGKKSPKQAFWLSWLCGFVFFLSTIYWLKYVTVFGGIVLCAYLAVYFGVFGVVFGFRFSVFGFRLSSKEGCSRPEPRVPSPASRAPKFRAKRGNLFLIPAIWVILEYIRSHLLTGFGWALLGYSQYKNLPLIQIADIVGVYGVSFLIVMANCSVYSVLAFQFSKKTNPASRAPRPEPRIIHILVTIFFFAAVLTYGHYRLYRAPSPASRAPIRISLIQGNIPQWQKWDPFYKEAIIQRYRFLTKEAAKDNPDLIIWPETSVPGFLSAEEGLQQEIFGIAKDAGIPILAGAPRMEKGEFYNSALLISAQGEVVNRYDKIHLVPFGEYIPGGEFFANVAETFGIGNFKGGDERTLFRLRNFKTAVRAKKSNRTPKLRPEGGNFGVLICFEDLFPDLVREFVKRGAGFMVNITNDAWFMKSSAPYQHLQASVFRAVENRINLLRAANTGVSCFIAPSGRIMSRVEDGSKNDIFVRGYNTDEIVIFETLGFYTRFGDIFVLLCGMYVLWIFMLVKIEKLILKK